MEGVCGCWMQQWVIIYSEQLNLQLQMTDKGLPVKNSKIFSLIRLKAYCKMPPTRVDFSSPHLPSAHHLSILPAFNHDRLHCTPAFLLPNHQKYYSENLPFEEAQFQERIRRCLIECGSMGQSGSEEGVKMAAPSSTYCQVCQDKFQDYFTHILTKKHTKRQHSSTASPLIQELCHAFANTPSHTKNKPIRKERRQEQQQRVRKERRGERGESARQEGHAKGQNFSTGLVEDSANEFKL